MFFGFVNIVFRVADEDFIIVIIFWWEFNVDFIIFIYDGANESIFGINYGIVMFMWDVNFYLSYICL